jgi:hypothetical protein
MQQNAPKSKAIRTTPPPTAIPAIAPVDSGLGETGDFVGAMDIVGLGIARVGDRDATEACCVK